MVDTGKTREGQSNNQGNHGVPADSTGRRLLRQALRNTMYLIVDIRMFVRRHPLAVAVVFIGAGVYVIRGFIPSPSPTARPGLHWGEFQDGGCVQRGQKRMYARLFGLGLKEDWKAACESMPARINGKWYDKPVYCDHKRILGIYGIFHVKDPKCN
ncbi:hypothetical protein BDV93DRAFT_611240 [Ceratobasidium sp. AG-I]|nr:hypothetical protein BDV93DRAFT_611240 [Ceratobasidium sp. AG-I]